MMGSHGPVTVVPVAKPPDPKNYTFFAWNRHMSVMILRHFGHSDTAKINKNADTIVKCVQLVRLVETTTKSTEKASY